MIVGTINIPCLRHLSRIFVSNEILIATNEIPKNKRVDFDSTVTAMALTAKEMNSKYKETSEGGLAVSLVLC